ncbi:MAG TPA: zf-HC2 domain-containing protein, partial [Planctomycetota bacterium]|nr:zf-HC2 domain-containing protein [Planctomycetota bacterium]
LALADARLDGPLPPRDAEALRAHLEACASCAGFAADGRRVHEALAAPVAAEPGPDFTDRVIDALDRGPRRAGARPARAAFLLRAVVGVAATAAVAAGAILLLPVEEAGAAVASRVPVLAAPVPDLAEPATRILAGVGDAVPAWIAAAAGAAALAGAFAAGRRRRP